ncbi:MAG: phosphatase PAP2 family protein [Oligoflexia bacterium]|nr:phosphatase PAP2 family protein [Oligoflexia bacterium]
MMPPLLQRLRLPARLKSRDIWLTLVPMILWIAALYARPLLIHPSCSASNPCSQFKVFWLDQPSIGNLSGDADFYSYFAQNMTAVIAVLMPFLYQVSVMISGRVGSAIAFKAAMTDLLIFIQTWFLNGFFTECGRLFSGRARPYLYGRGVDPKLFLDPQNYTSFYSGHTSFVSAACIYLMLTLFGRGAPAWLLIGCGVLSECLITTTGVFRILAGRHFLSDVLVAIVMGSLTALLIAIVHRPPLSPSLHESC